MSKISMTSTKYVIVGSFETQGYIDKPDLIGSFFGQTEGLIGEDLEFSELQRKGKLGRIDIDLKKKNGKCYGTFNIPTALDKVEVSIVAASLESVTKISHTEGKIRIDEIRDAREDKRKVVLRRAEEILKNLKEELPDSTNITKNISESVRVNSLEKYDGGKIIGGPNIKGYEEIILVEGRADVINLLKNGYENVIAFNGSNIPKFIRDLSKEKTIVAFLDGDKAGRDELRELKDTIYLDYYTFAPQGYEVEELGLKEINKALKNKVKYVEKNNLFSKLKSVITKNKENPQEKIKKGLNRVNKRVDEFQKNNLYKEKPNKEAEKKEEKYEEGNNSQVQSKQKLNNHTSNSNLKRDAQKKEKDEKNLYLKKNEIEKLKNKIDNLKNKNDEFLILNNRLNIIKKGKIENLYKIDKLENSKYLLMKGVAENSILNKSKGIGVEIIISEKKSSNLKHKKPIVRLFNEVFDKN